MIRQPIVSGRFYPSSKTELINLIEASYSNNLGVKDTKFISPLSLEAMVLPHAGYVFSGPVASWCYSRLNSVKQLPETIILLGPKHTHYGERFSVSDVSSWMTPLGSVSVNQKLASSLVSECQLFKLDNDAHQFEHSLEVQLPFLQHIYADRKLDILPIAIGFDNYGIIQRLGLAIKKLILEERTKNICIIVSSDFSHESSRDDAYQQDTQAIELIKNLDGKGFYELVVSENRSICGFMPICVLIEALSGKEIIATKLKYATSMDVMKHDKGVGYASIIFEEDAQ